MAEIKVLFIGDIVGKLGRQTVRSYLVKHAAKYDLILANGENLAHGTGLTEKTVKEMLAAGVQVLTTGNHVYHRPEIYPALNKLSVVRPANYPEGAPGRPYIILTVKKVKIAIVNLLGRVFMGTAVNSPFVVADQILQQLKKAKVKLILLDFHAEATAEKVALYRYLDGRVTAILGTHTHIQTADEEISAKGTAFISDVGGVYAKDSVIGVEAAGILQKFLTALPHKHVIPENGACLFNAVKLRLNTAKGRALEIKRINEIL
jgi:2',3'-cyclic-nucleotide 2'-phosphodiesterase